MTKKQIWT